MAYIIGLISKEQAQELEEEGYELEDVPKELVPPMYDKSQNVMKMIYIDENMCVLLEKLE